MSKRDHFNVLVVCALQSELDSTKHVLENDTGSKFVNVHNDLPQINLIATDRWNSTPLKVAMCAQVQMGGIESQKLISELAKYFTANVVVMTGICAGDENKHGNVQHGCVVIAKQTTVVAGGKMSKDNFQVFAQLCNLDKRMIGAIGQLVAEGNSEKSAEWVKYVPDGAKRPSPRLVRELILELVFDNPGITKRNLLQEMDNKKLPGMTKMNYDQILEIMQKQKEPLAWIRAQGKHNAEFVVTDTGEGYIQTEATFLRDDVITAIFDSMVAIPNVTQNLKTDMKTLKVRAGNRKLKAVDMESHMFMEQVKESFGVGVVMKGISDYGSQESKVDYYQVFAASTSAAFLRHLMTEKQFLFETRKPAARSLPALASASAGSRVGASAPETSTEIKDLVATIPADVIIQEVLDQGAHLWFQIGKKMGIKAAQLTTLTADKPLASSKLLALISAKQAQLGNTRALELLLSACDDVKIYGAILQGLQPS